MFSETPCVPILSVLPMSEAMGAQTEQLRIAVQVSSSPKSRSSRPRAGGGGLTPSFPQIGCTWGWRNRIYSTSFWTKYRNRLIKVPFLPGTCWRLSKPEKLWGDDQRAIWATAGCSAAKSSLLKLTELKFFLLFLFFLCRVGITVWVLLASGHGNALFPCPERSNIFLKDKYLCVWFIFKE